MKFVYDLAKTLNDPSFANLITSSNMPKAEKSFKRNFRTLVSVRRTEVSLGLDVSYDDPLDIKLIDPD